VTCRAVDLFCGAGGLTLGAVLGGVDVVAAVDNDKFASQTYRSNFKKIVHFENDIRKLSPTELAGGQCIDIVLAGPPCQSFSTSNQKTRQDDNPLNNYVFEPLRFVRELRPRAVIVENVHGLAVGSRVKYLNRLINRLKKLGYYCSVNEVRGEHCELPQNRTRLFIIATQKREFRAELRAIVQPSVRDAIADLPYLKNGNNKDLLPYRSTAHSKYAEKLRKTLEQCDGHLVTKNAADVALRFKFVPQGGNWQNIPEAMMDNYTDRTRCHTGIYHRLEWDTPSKVLGNFRKNMLIHPSQSRGLSIREAARLQSFPDTYVFAGSIGKRQQQVGNELLPVSWTLS
jgi:DNA (cytosine-5)-methyltransferase 1